MGDLKILFFITIVILVIYIIMNINSTETLYIESNIDNNKYLIRRGKLKTNEYLQESANTLAEINKRVVILIDYLDSKYKDDFSKNYFIRKLKSNYNPNILSEAAIDKRYTTYTIDKSNMHVCLRQRDSIEKVYDINLLMYVILHELAHLCNYNIHGEAIQGHGEEFRSIFKFLIIESIKIGIYNYEDYTEIPKEYCGIIINTTILPREQFNLLQ
jgi:hypothetical protein